MLCSLIDMQTGHLLIRRNPYVRTVRWPFDPGGHSACISTDFAVDNSNRFNPLMHKVAKMVTWNNGVRRHTGLTHGF